MRWHRKGLMLALGKDSCLTNEKAAWANESLCLKWCVEVRARDSKYPSHLTTGDQWKRWLSSSMGVVEYRVLWLGVRQGMSSVLWTEKEIPRFFPFSAISLKIPCRRRMLPW